MTLSLNCKDAGDPVCTHYVWWKQRKNYYKTQRDMEQKYTAIQKKVGMMRSRKTQITFVSS